MIIQHQNATYTSHAGHFSMGTARPSTVLFRALTKQVVGGHRLHNNGEVGRTSYKIAMEQFLYYRPTESTRMAWFITPVRPLLRHQKRNRSLQI
jgi:hypothetical protein